MLKKSLLIAIALFGWLVNQAQTPIRQLVPREVKIAADTAETMANNGRKWYDFVTEKWRVNLGGTNYTVYTGTPTEYSFGGGLTESSGTVTLGGTLPNSSMSLSHDGGSSTHRIVQTYYRNGDSGSADDVTFSVNAYAGSASVYSQLDMNANDGSPVISLRTQSSSAGGANSYFGLGYNGIVMNLGSDATGDTYRRNSSGVLERLAIGSAGTLLRSTGTLPAYSTFTIPNTIAANSLFVANSTNTLSGLTLTAGQSVRLNAGGTAFEGYTPGSGGGHTIEYAGSPMTARSNLNFTSGFTLTDNDPDTEVKVGGAYTGSVTFTGSDSWKLDQSGTASYEVENEISVEFDTPQVLLTRTGTKLVLPASTTSSAALLIPHGDRPTTPTNGNIWTETGGVFAQVNGSTVELSASGSGIGGSTGSVDNAIPRADGTGTSTLQGSVVTIDDSGNTIIGNASTAGNKSISAVSSTGNTTLTLIPEGTGSLGITALTSIETTNANTNGALTQLLLNRQSSGTPANGIGSAVQFNIETSAGNTEAGAFFSARAADVTAASENFDFTMSLMEGGATASEKFRFKGEGAMRMYVASAATTSGTTNAVDLSVEDVDGVAQLFAVTEDDNKICITCIQDVEVPGTSLTLDITHNGKFLYTTSSSPVTITLPSGLPRHYSCIIVQDGSGAITLDTSGVTYTGATSTANPNDKIAFTNFKAANTYSGN